MAKKRIGRLFSIKEELLKKSREVALAAVQIFNSFSITEEPTDAVIRVTAACVRGSDLWPYCGANPITQPTPMGHEYCGVEEDVGKEVTRAKKGERRAIKALLRP